MKTIHTQFALAIAGALATSAWGGGTACEYGSNDYYRTADCGRALKNLDPLQIQFRVDDNWGPVNSITVIYKGEDAYTSNAGTQTLTQLSEVQTLWESDLRAAQEQGLSGYTLDMVDTSTNGRGKTTSKRYRFVISSPDFIRH